MPRVVRSLIGRPVALRRIVHTLAPGVAAYLGLTRSDYDDARPEQREKAVPLVIRHCRSVVAARDLYEMVAELCLDRPLDFVERRAEHDRVELADHLPRAEAAEVAAALPRRTGRMLPRDLGEIRAVDYLLLELLTLILGVDENMSCRRFCHGGYPLFDDPLGPVRLRPVAEVLPATLYRLFGASRVCAGTKDQREIVRRHRNYLVQLETV